MIHQNHQIVSSTILYLLMFLAAISHFTTGLIALFFVCKHKKKNKKLEDDFAVVCNYCESLSSRIIKLESDINFLISSCSNIDSRLTKQEINHTPLDKHQILVTAHNKVVHRLNENTHKIKEMFDKVEYVWNSWRGEWESGEKWKEGIVEDDEDII